MEEHQKEKQPLTQEATQSSQSLDFARTVQDVLLKAKSFCRMLVATVPVRLFKKYLKPKNPFATVSYVLLLSVLAMSLIVNLVGYVHFIISGGYGITFNTGNVFIDISAAFQSSTAVIIYQSPTIEILCFLTTAALILGHLSDFPKILISETLFAGLSLFMLWIFCVWAPSTSWLWFSILAIWLFFVDPKHLGKYSLIGLLVAYLGIPFIFTFFERPQLVLGLIVFALLFIGIGILGEKFPSKEREDGVGGNASTIVAETKKQKDGTEVIFVNPNDKVYRSKKGTPLDAFSFGDSSSIRRAHWGSSASEWLCDQKSYDRGNVHIVDKQTGKNHPILPAPPKGYE